MQRPMALTSSLVYSTRSGAQFKGPERRIVVSRLSAVAALGLCLAVLLTSPSTAVTLGFMAPGSYDACPLPDRWSAPWYNQSLMIAIMQSSANTTSYRYENTGAFEDRMLAKVNTVGFFSYSGHGRTYGVYPGGANLHWYARSTSQLAHDSAMESYDVVNTCWDELRDVGLGPGLKWTVFYTCNFLTDGGSDYNKDRMMAMFKGLHLSLGFADSMYIEPDSGQAFGNRIYWGWELINAWHSANIMYQEPHDTTISKAVGALISKHDSFNSWSSTPPNYVPYVSPSKPGTESQFSTMWFVTI